MLRPSATLGSLARFRYAEKPGYHHMSEPNSYADRTSTFSPSHSRQFVRTPITTNRGDGPRSFTPSRTGSSTSNPQSPIHPRDRGMKSLSRNEYDERRKKGLCFRCGQVYGPAHKCPEGRLRILLLGEDEDDANEGTNLMLDIPSPSEIHSELDSPTEAPTGACMSLDSEGVSITEGGSKTLNLEGSLPGIPVSMLVDSGASHNFLSSRLAAGLGLLIGSIAGVRIKLDDGHFVLVKHQCKGLEISVGSCTFFIDVLVFDIGNLDLILGMDWLKSLGEVTHDWGHSWMKFLHKGTLVTLYGVSNDNHSPAALQQWLAWDDDDYPNSPSSCLTMQTTSVQTVPLLNI